MAVLLSCAGPALAQDFSLVTPIDCDLTQTCYIQHYVDHDPTDAAQDYTCAALTYDAHSGTDFALPSLAMMQRGVPVRAGADGIVGGARDGMNDTGASRADIAGRECGNGLRLTHDNGWSTQYCHLREGSIAVREGQKVAAGDFLGLVGQSGLADFPHLHLVVRQNGDLVDPFDPDGALTCAAPGNSTLWQTTPVHRPGGLISLGFSDAIPEFSQVRAGTAHLPGLTSEAPALVIWGYAFGTRKGDIFRLSLIGPEGEVIARDIPLEKAQAQTFRAIGKKRRAARWTAGTYTGTTALVRNGNTLESREITLRLR